MDLRLSPEEQAFRAELRALHPRQPAGRDRRAHEGGPRLAQAGHRRLAAHPEQARLGRL